MDPPLKLQLRECEALINSYLSETLNNARYDPETCRELSCEMSETIKTRVKKAGLLPPRYKCVVYVVLGEMKDQGVSVSSESAWDKTTDNYVAANFQNNSIFCAATMFAVYME